jgi:hypothetical protein
MNAGTTSPYVACRHVGRKLGLRLRSVWSEPYRFGSTFSGKPFRFRISSHGRYAIQTHFSGYCALIYLLALRIQEAAMETVPVTERALIQRINRKLHADGAKLRTRTAWPRPLGGASTPSVFVRTVCWSRMSTLEQFGRS